ncbi:MULTISPECIES: AMP-binding protein [unclassified Streptomyces]|uniref:AMP-binding protein n=1 Tax=unclassified Streptomyces TaxID=2593676 RepID=UPI0022B6D1CA|nr:MULTISPECIES: class I adenylate-forming enzyme family protein [unclassified Streptomyces]MCZ7417808.1 class I adenylate-forming enzyme family protein [Streptomyces sp. WMMC897]MCZ7432387.1 class I adenylate-forming enzyme family protein [Streptomyces sp. WMMC1477]
MPLPDDLPKPGKLFSLGLITQQAAKRYPESLFYLDRPFDVAPELGLRPTYQQVAELVEEYAARLYAAGVRPGDTVAVFKSHNADILFLACAIGRVGAVPAMLAPFLEWPTVVTMMSRLKPAHFLTDPDTRARAGEHFDALRAHAPSVLLTHGEAAGLPAVSRTAPGEAPPYPDLPEDMPALITHTSGTTGVPKLVAAARRGTQLPINTQAQMAKLLRYRETFAMCISFVHARTYAALATALQLGIGIAPLADADVDSVREVLSECRPGCVEAHPNMYMHWEELAGIPDGPFERVRIFMSTFDAIHPRSIRALLGASKRRLPLFIQSYGQTETGPVTMRIYTRRNLRKADGRCVGFVFPGMTRARIRPRPQDKGTRNGYIQARSSGVALTYVGQQELYDERSEDGWWNLQDIGYRTRWGCVHLLDREFDQTDELESLLSAEDTVLEAMTELTEAVFVRVGETMRPVVCTRRDRPLDLAAWKAAVADLPPLPDPVHVAWEHMPHTATWKVKRNVLAAGLTDGSIPALNGVLN